MLLTHLRCEKVMLEALSGSWALLRVPLQHLEDEIDRVLIRIWNDLLEWRYGTAWKVDAPLGCKLIPLGPLLRRSAQH